ncbi:hypothetical protein Efla_001135 [Eimeria flavescens]
MHCPWKPLHTVRSASPAFKEGREKNRGDGLELNLIADRVRLPTAKLCPSVEDRVRQKKNRSKLLKPIPPSSFAKADGHSLGHQHVSGRLSSPNRCLVPDVGGLHGVSPSQELEDSNLGMRYPFATQSEADGGAALIITNECSGSAVQRFLKPSELQSEAEKRCLSSNQFDEVRSLDLEGGEAGEAGCRSSVGTGPGSDSSRMPPWAAVHVGSHGLTNCPPAACGVFAKITTIPRVRPLQMQSPMHEACQFAPKGSIIPRRRSFSVFREWLAEHGHSSMAVGPRGQYPARRELSQSARTRASSKVGFVAAEIRSAAEKRARHAVEAEIRQLSISQTAQQQQETSKKTQQGASLIDTLVQEELRYSAEGGPQSKEIKTFLGSTYAAAAQIHKSSKQTLQQQPLAHVWHADNSGKPRSATQPSSTGQSAASAEGTLSMLKGRYKAKRGVEGVQQGRCTWTCKRPASGASFPATTEGDRAALSSRPCIVERPASSTIFQRKRPQGPAVRTLEQYVMRYGSKKEAISVGATDEAAAIDFINECAAGSGNEEDSQSFNPLEEALLLLYKARRADGYVCGTCQSQSSRRASHHMNIHYGSARSHQTARTNSSGTDCSGLHNSMPQMFSIAEHAKSLCKGQRVVEKQALRQMPKSVKLLPLEAFDLPEAYGEPSPRRLLDRCRYECRLRRTQDETRKATNTSVSSRQQLESPCVSLDACSILDRAAAASKRGSKVPPAEEIRSYRGQETFSCCFAAPEPQMEQTQYLQESVTPAARSSELLQGDTTGAWEDGTAVNAANAAAPQECGGEEEVAHAEVLQFVDNSWKSVPCTVLRYDSEQRRFEVKLADGTPKAVRRLALRFCFEAPHMQRQRLEACNYRRQQSLLRQQLLNSINDLPSTFFPTLPQAIIGSIIRSAVGIRRLRRCTLLMDTLQPAVDHLKERFLQATKLSAVLHCVECLQARRQLSKILHTVLPQLEEPLWQADQPSNWQEAGRSSPLLQLLQPLLSSPPPAVGRPNFGASDAYHEALLALRKKPLFANPRTFKLSLLLVGKFCELAGLCFFDLPGRKAQGLSLARLYKRSAALKPSEWTLPDPDQYLVYQQALAQDVADALRELARDSLCHALISTLNPLQATANAAIVATTLGPSAVFRATNAAAATIQDTVLHRQLLRFNAMLSSGLLSFVISSLNAWKLYMQRAVEEPLDPAFLEVAAAAPAAAAAAGFRIRGNVPCLLQLDIVFSDGTANFHPSAEKQVYPVERILLTCGHTCALITATSEADLVPFALTAEDPLLCFSVLEPYLEEADAAVATALQMSFAEAEPLRMQVDAVASVLQQKLELSVDAPEGLNIQEIQSDLAKYKGAQRLLRAIPSRRIARLLLVDCDKAKTTLRLRAQHLQEELCSKALKWLENETHELQQEWLEALNKVSVVPTNEQELIALKKYLAFISQETAHLECRGQKVSSLISLLEEYFAVVPAGLQRQAFELDLCSMRLKVALCETNGILDLAKERLESKRVSSVQQLQSDLGALRIDVDSAAAAFQDVEHSVTYVPELAKLRNRIQAASAEIDSLRKAEELFGLEPSEFQQLDSACVLFDRLDELWTAASEFMRAREEWLSMPVANLDSAEVENKLQQWRQATLSVRRVAGVFRSAQPLQACDGLVHAIGNFQEFLPLIKTVTHPSFLTKHWQQLWARLKLSATFEGEESRVSLSALLQRGFPAVAQAIEFVGSAAMRESRTKACFQKMRGAWRALHLELVPLSEDKSGLRILKNFDSIRSLIEEHQTSVQSLQASQLVGGIEVQAREWTHKLSELERLCSLLESFQTSWIYLVPIFSYLEIQQELTKESQRFEAISRFWAEQVVGRVDENANLLDLVELEELPQELEVSCNDMALITRGLGDFLEKRRIAFPRFFFLSNEELVRLLAGGCESQALTPHIQKCFEGIHSVLLDDSQTKITAIRSHRGEVLPLVKALEMPANGTSMGIEALFSTIEREMYAALQRAMQRAWESFFVASSRLTWSTETCACSQVALAIAHCCWTAHVEAAILQQQLPQLVKDIRRQMQELVEATRGAINKTTLLTVAALMTIDVHCRDVTEELLRHKTSSIDEFQWICHLRSYWPGDRSLMKSRTGGQGLPHGAKGRDNEGEAAVNEELQLRMLESSLKYGFELLRSPDRLVVTSLTDRCYRTLMTAMHFQYGGAPEGPAGTGKTETIKDLAKAAGKPCLVFNCSESLDGMALAALLKGLAAGGGWCCFDEFNRLQLDVLSVVALQISSIQQAIRRKALTFVFEDTDLRLNATCAVNITMNPGYAGRSILPDTLKASTTLDNKLKALFRPCAMMTPDSALIAEVMLYCYGFEEARKLSRKMVACLQLASEQLSNHSHYDFGMRAAVAVLNTARRLFCQRSRAMELDSSTVLSESEREEKAKQNEVLTICRALRSANIPKLLPADQLAFDEILKDIFEEGNLKDTGSQHPLKPFLATAATALTFEPSDSFIAKGIQVLETLEHRHGLMLVGASSTGKTAVLKSLVAALKLQKAAQATATDALETPAAKTDMATPQKVTLAMEAELRTCESVNNDLTSSSCDGIGSSTKCICRFIYPKSIDVEELYGSYDPTTRDWKGGALEQAVREASGSQDVDVWRWIILDGPVDVAWVENLNTVLDDNKKLCLSNGEVLQVSSQTAFLFEVTDLRCASPATVSRCGMVYFHEDVLPWERLVDAWCHYSPVAGLLGERLVDEVKQTLTECCAVCGGQAKIAEMVEQSLEGAMVFALLWGTAGFLALADRAAFDLAFRSLHSGRYDALKQMGLSPPGCLGDEQSDEVRELSKRKRRFTQHLPPTGSCFDYFWDVQRSKWLPWSSLCPGIDIPGRQSISPFALQHVLVPTPETAQIEHFLDLLPVTGSAHLLLAGEAGCGKSKCTLQMLHNPSPPLHSAFSFLSLSLTGASTPKMVRQWLGNRLERTRNGNLRPIQYPRCVLLIDDVHLPTAEESGAQPVGELLRQLLDCGGWQQRGSCKVCRVDGVTLCAICRSAHQQHEQLSARLTRHFVPIMAVPHTRESLTFVLQQLFMLRFDKCSNAVVSSLQNIARLTVQLHAYVQQRLPPVPARWSQQWSARDCWRIVQRMACLSQVGLEFSQQLLCCWLHEVRRIFEDRVCSKADLNVLTGAITDALRDVVSVSPADLEPSAAEPLLFAFQEPQAKGVANAAVNNSTAGSCELGSRVYRRVTFSEAHRLCKDGLAQYSLMHPKEPLSLVLFPQAVEHALKCMNTLLQPQGHALLLGVGGSGRRSAARLGASLANFDLVEAHGTGNQMAISEWQDYLKAVILAAGALEKFQALVIQGEHLARDEIAADVCTLLQLRELPEVFSADEKVSNLEGITQGKKSLGASDSSNTASLELLTAACRQRLRVCICCSPSDMHTPALLRRFPSLTSCCTVSFFHGWTAAALYSVATQKLQFHEVISKSLCEACADIFEASGNVAELYREEQRRFFYVTPSSYLRFLEAVCSVYIEMLNQQQRRQAKYELGLTKLREMSLQVKVMQQQLEMLQPELIKASEDTQSLMLTLNLKQEHAASTMALVEAEERECRRQADAAALVEQECQEQLAEVMPTLLNAEEALKKLSKADITELKSMKSPPSGVVKVMEALCKLFGVQTNLTQGAPGQPRQVDYWAAGKKHLLGNSRFLQRLLDFDRDAIAPNIMTAIAPFEEDVDFDPDVINKASVAATSLCLWVKALIAYDRAACAVRPRRVALQQAQCELQAAEALLHDKKQELQNVEDLIRQLSTQYEQALRRSESIQQEVQTCEKRLSVAEKLIGSLGGESTRWSQSLDNLREQAKCLIGDATLSAAFVEFGGAFRPLYRVQCVTRWRAALEQRGLKIKTNYSFQETLTNPEDVQQWLMRGLPNDELSIENATIILRTQCCPMLIDPHQQATQWVAQTFPDIKVLRAEEPNLLRSMQLLIQCGAVVVIECFSEGLNPSLNPLLALRRPLHAGGAFPGPNAGSDPAERAACILKRAPSSVTVGNNVVEINPTFRLLLKTPLNAPHFPPEVCARLTLVDFSVGCKGLEQRLLRLALQAAAPDIHATCLRLVREGAETRAQLGAAEEHMLEALSEAKDNVLDDMDLLGTLRHARAVSESCAERLQELQKAQAAADATLSLYSPGAQRAASFFQVLQQLESAHPMYLFSVQNFQQYVCLYTSELMGATLRKLYKSVSPCLFESHKPLLRVLLALQSLTLRGAATSEELQQLLAPALAPSTEPQNNTTEAHPTSQTSLDAAGTAWLTESCRLRLQGLQRLGEPFVQLVAAVLDDNGEWEGVLYEENPLATVWPEQWSERLSLLQQTLLVQCVRPECLLPCLQVLVEAELGSYLREVTPLRLGEALELAGPKAPLLILLAPGADPQAALLQQSEVAHMHNKIVAVAMGKGQGPKAVAAIRSCAEKGQWVILQNCHLGRGFLNQLSVLVSDLVLQNQHKDFRLILTTAPCDDFPSAILLQALPQSCARALNSSHQDTHPRGTALKPVVFQLCFLHALLLGRRRFGPLGWVCPVDFLASDLLISLQQLKAAVPEESFQPLPWELLQYLASEVNYGGRVTDEWDRRLLQHICRQVMAEGYLAPDSPLSPFETLRAPSPNLTCAETLAYIRALPVEESPEVFGLLANAALAVASTESSAMQQLLMRVQQQQGAALYQEATMAAANNIRDIHECAKTLLAQVPPQLDLDAASSARPHAYENAMDTVLLQELARYNSLISLTSKLLKSSLDAATGLMEYSTHVEELNQCLRHNRVPQAIVAASYPMAFGLSSWLANLKRRVDFMRRWLKEGPPHPFWLPGCFNVRAVCTAMLQAFARCKGVALDTISFEFHVLSNEHSGTDLCASQEEHRGHETPPPPPFAHDVSGLFLHGASWSSEDAALIEQDYWEVFAPLPLLRLQPTPLNVLSQPARVYNCPLYCTSRRSDVSTTYGLAKNLIFSVPLPMLEGDSEALWAKRGAALVAQIEE